ncbi:MAG: hypothetical protein WCI45_00010 [Desulfuromonadales bacterium]
MRPIIVYNDTCVDMLNCYFNGTALPDNFDLALVAYSFTTPWVAPANISEIRAVNSYDRRRVVVDIEAAAFASNVSQIELKDFVTSAPPQFTITGGLQQVETSTSILGWALLKNGSPTQPFSNTSTIVCAAPFDDPISPSMMRTYLTISPLVIQLGHKSPSNGINFIYPEGFLYDALTQRILRKYFGHSIVDVPQLEIVLISSTAPVSEADDRRGLVEISGATGYTRKDLAVNSGIVSVVNGMPQISWPEVTIDCGLGTAISGYAIVIKSVLPAVSDVADGTTSGPILMYSPFAAIITTPIVGLRLSVTPTIKLSYGTPG